MKSFSQFLESVPTVAANGIIGNLNNGVMNHYIPIENIVINVRNIFAPWFGLVVEPGEDNRTLKVYNSTFSSPEAVDAVLNFKPDGRTSLREYVAMQGLPLYKTVSTGNTIAVYFYSADIAGQEDPSTFAANNSDIMPSVPVDDPEPQIESLDEDDAKIEINMSVVEGISNMDDETEVRDIISRTFYDIAGDAGETGSDEKWSKAIGANVELPKDCYWALVKDEDGHKSIALRKKVTKRLSFGRSKKYTVSLINIYNNKKNGIWVGCFDHKDRLDVQDTALVDSILAFIGAVPTDDACVYELAKPALTEPVAEDCGELDVLYTVYDEDGQPIQSFTTKQDAKAAAEKFSNDNKVKCTVKKETL